MADKGIIITADDLGMYPEVNDAVMDGYDSGIISSTGLRVNGPASRSAMVSASMRSGLGTGLHLVLCEGTSTLPRRHIPNLVDAGGRFVDRPLEAMWLYRRGGGLKQELRAEIRAQVEKFLSGGLVLSYVSSSYGLHLLPSVLSILRELSLEYPIWAMRKPCGPTWKYSREFVVGDWERRAENAAMRPALAWGRLRSGRFRGPDRVEILGRHRPVTEGGMVELLASLKSGVTELVCHPGSLLPRYDGMGEAAALTSPMVRKELAAREDIDLVSYRDISEEA
jgi:predicted glycoside hydrolase/deacetylase ChbG (UPF0249 family)